MQSPMAGEPLRGRVPVTDEGLDAVLFPELRKKTRVAVLGSGVTLKAKVQVRVGVRV